MTDRVSGKLQEALVRCAAYARLFAGTLATTVLSGCPDTTSLIEAEDTDVFQRGLRASFNVNGGSRAASEARSGHAIEVGHQGTRIGEGQSLSAGQRPVIHNGTTFSSPNQLRNDFDFSYSDISWRLRKFQGGQLGGEFSGGIGQSSLGLTVSSPAQSASQHFTNTGLQGGVGLVLRASPSSSLHGRASFSTLFGTGVNFIRKYEFYYANALHKNLSLRAGYSDWKVEGSGGSGMSDFRAQFAGPSLVLEFNFNLGD